MSAQIPCFVLVLIPQKPFIDWLDRTLTMLEIELPTDVKDISENDLYQDCPLFMLPPLKDNDAYESYINEHYAMLFAYFLDQWCADQRAWPVKKFDDITLKLFNEFFRRELHSRVYDLTIDHKEDSK